jgi:nucleoside-diphosphate-sugar epimerase
VSEANGGKVLVTGSAGFIGGYVVEELLARGYTVVGIDNFSKYGPVAKSYDDHPRYSLIVGDASDPKVVGEAVDGCRHLIAGAALIGGISYFHSFAYDLIAENERIIAATCDAAIAAHATGTLEKVTYLSSSMVFESTDRWPSVEGDERLVPPPASSYGFQKLAVEYFARAAHDQYGLPFTICRPFNCVGIGEMRARADVEVLSGNVKLAMSHVVPDLVHKVAKGQDPLHLLGDGTQVRHYTYGADLAKGIVTAMEHPAARNEDFNLSTAESTTVLELAENIWHRLRGDDTPFRYVSDEAFEHDVARRVPSVEKAKAMLGYEATTTLDEMLDVVVPWIVQAVDDGLL